MRCILSQKGYKVNNKFNINVKEQIKNKHNNNLIQNKLMKNQNKRT